jgi:GTP cyclohydrolase II
VLLDRSLADVAAHGHGVLVYVRAPGGEPARLRHLAATATGADLQLEHHAQATAVSGVALAILRDLGISGERVAPEARGAQPEAG